MPAAEGSSFVQAVFNVVNVMMGVGILTLPFALKSSGWIGIALLWLMGLICNYTGKALVECAQVVAKRRGLGGAVVGYEEIAEETFGPIGRLIVSAIIYVELFGTCCLLFILEGDNLFNLLGTSVFKNATSYMLAAACVMIPTVWLPSLSALSYLGFLGVSATTCTAGAVLYTLLSGNFPVGAVTDSALWATLPLVFGIMTFCYSGHGVFPAIQASMKQPKDFPQVLNVAYAIVAGLCTFIGAAGYYMYGPSAADIIIFNLPAGLLATMCCCMVLVNPVAKFALTMEPVAAALVKAAGSPAGIGRLALRTGLSIAILLAAKSLPFLAYVMALVGSFMTVSVSVTFPAICHQILLKDSLSPARSAWNYAVAALGICCTLFGTAASMKSLAAKAASTAVAGA